MIYRRKMYQVNPDKIKEFNRHFNENLLPVQLKNGARLIGRWMAQEQDGCIDVLAIWEYDDRDAFERIEASVRNDADHMKRVNDWKEKMGGKHGLKNVFYNIEQDFLESTVSLPHK